MENPKHVPCGHSCILGKPKGMAPNGPCRCLDGLDENVRHLVRAKLLEGSCLAKETRELLSLVANFSFSDEFEKTRKIDKVCEAWIPIKRLARATLAAGEGN